MRKIEQLMNAAIKAGKNWTNANTSVSTDDNGLSTVYLHGNKIAEAVSYTHLTLPTIA